MNKILYGVSIVIFLIGANLMNYAIERTYGFPSNEIMITRVVEAIILALLFYFRTKNAVMNKTIKIVGFIAVVLGIFAPILIWIPILSGFIYKSKKTTN